MTILTFHLITGFMVGIEFPGQEDVVMVLDLGIVRIVMSRHEEEKE